MKRTRIRENLKYLADRVRARFGRLPSEVDQIDDLAACWFLDKVDRLRNGEYIRYLNSQVLVGKRFKAYVIVISGVGVMWSGTDRRDFRLMLARALRFQPFSPFEDPDDAGSSHSYG